MKKTGELKHIIRLEVVQGPSGLFMCQDKCTKDLLKKNYRLE